MQGWEAPEHISHTNNYRPNQTKQLPDSSDLKAAAAKTRWHYSQGQSHRKVQLAHYLCQPTSQSRAAWDQEGPLRGRSPHGERRMSASCPPWILVALSAAVFSLTNAGLS